MHLISCERCGTVLDMDRIEKPDIHEEDGDGYSISDKHAIWDGSDYVPAINCPVCKTLIAYDTGDY